MHAFTIRQCLMFFCGALLVTCLSGTTANAQQPPNVRLFEAIKSRNVPAARRAILDGADPNVGEPRLTNPRLKTWDRGGRPYAGETALNLAIENENPQMVTLLI